MRLFSRTKDEKKEIRLIHDHEAFLPRTKDERQKTKDRKQITNHDSVIIIGDITGDINEGDIFIKDFADKALYEKAWHRRHFCRHPHIPSLLIIYSTF